MVTEAMHGGKKAYACGVCGLKYREKKDAGGCEEYCKEHPNMCNAEISARAIRE